MAKRSKLNILYKSVKPNPALDLLALGTLRKLISLEKTQFNELNLLFCSDTFIKGLNVSFRGKNKPTDILTFYYETGRRTGLTGDIALSLQTARRQAKELGNTLETELKVLLVHGFYHLLGFDHIADTEHKLMKSKETRAFKLLKLT